MAAVPKSSIHLEVLNGSGIPGVAHRLAETLRKQGFRIASVGDAPSTDHEATEVHVSSATPLAGEIVLAALGMKTAVVVPDAFATSSATPNQSDVTIIIGRDYGGLREASAVK